MSPACLDRASGNTCDAGSLEADVRVTFPGADTSASGCPHAAGRRGPHEKRDALGTGKRVGRRNPMFAARSLRGAMSRPNAVPAGTAT